MSARFGRLSRRGLALAGCAGALTAGAPALGAIFVDGAAPTGGDGATWSTAYRFLQDALIDASGSAEPGTEIRVADGVYRPDRSEASPDGTGDRRATFSLLERVIIRGGYAGLGSLDPNRRDVEQFATVLSGDLAGDDGPGFTNVADNSYHVVSAMDINATATVDGVSIARGYADRFIMDDFGAGIVCFRAAPTFIECTIRDNLATFQGGGLQCKENSAPRFTSCTFRGNRSLDNGGGAYIGASAPVFSDCLFTMNSGVIYAGGVCNRELSGALYERCTFSGNTAGEDQATGGGGGAMVNAHSTPVLIDCLFVGNTAIWGRGGALVNEPGTDPELGGSHPTISDCHFEANVAINGGAVYNIESNPLTTGCTFVDNRGEDLYGRNAGGAIYNGDSSPQTFGCTFVGNQAARGGAVYNNLSGNPLFVDCLFAENTAVSDAGGGMSTYYATATLARCTFTGNAAATGGGGLQNFVATTILSECTISGNRSSTDGGGLYNVQGAFVLENCDLSDNSANGVGGGLFNGQVSDVTITDCLISGNDATAGGGVHTHALSTLALSGTRCCDNTPDDIHGAYDDDGSNEFYEECPISCPADLDGNATVDFADLLLLLSAWGPCAGCPEDLNDDGVISFGDILALLGAWGPCPG